MCTPSRRPVGAPSEVPGSLLSLDTVAGVGRRTGTPLGGGSSRRAKRIRRLDLQGVPMTHDASNPTLSPSADTPASPDNAAPNPPFEAAERQYAERPRGVPNWHPEDGDFN